MNKKIASAKNIKGLEAELHDELYNMIYCLTLTHQSTKEFKRYFKKDMFYKINTAACIHVLHFLLNVLSPEQFKNKITWPIFDKKMESQFFMDVVKFVNDIGAKKEDFGLPKLDKSTLQTPGGMKFINLLCKLTSFVLYTVLKRSEGPNDCTPLPVKVDPADKWTAMTVIAKQEKAIAKKYAKLGQTQAEFKKKHEEVKKIAFELEEKKNVTEKLLLEAKHNHTETGEHLKMEIEDLTKTICDLPTAQLIVEQKLKILKWKEEIIKKCCDLTEILNSKKNCLKLKCGSPVTNLIDYLENFLAEIEVNKNSFLFGKKVNLSQEISLVEENSEILSEVLEKYEKANTQILQFQTKLKKIINQENNNLDSQSTELYSIIETIYGSLFCDLNKIS